MKRLTLLAEYTPEESPIIFRHFDYVSDKEDYYLNFIYFPRDLLISPQKKIEIMRENNVDIFRFAREAIINVNEDIFSDLSDIYNVKDFCKTHRNYCKVGRKLICIPDAIDGLVLFYNKEILDKFHLKVPANWYELKETLIKIKENNSNLIPLALHNLYELRGWRAYYLIQHFIVQAGIDFKKVKTKDILSEKGTIESLDFLKDLIQMNLLGELNEPEYQSRSCIAYAKEKAVFILEGPWALSCIKQLNENLIGKTGFAILKNKVRRTVVGGRFFGVFKESCKKNFAKKFLEKFKDENGFYNMLLDYCKVPAYKKFHKFNKVSQELSNLFDKYGEFEIIRKDDYKYQDDIGNKIGDKLRSYIKGK